jgi:hypothetical protein
MINQNAMKMGLVFQDPDVNRHSPSRQFFKIVGEVSKNGPWQCVNLASNAAATYSVGDAKRLIAASPRVYCEVDLSTLLGKRVKIGTKFGSVLSGVVQEIRMNEIAIENTRFVIPKTLVIGSEEHDFAQILSIEIAE